MKKRKIILAILFGWLVGAAIHESRADTGDWWVNLNFGSRHVNEHNDLNEVNLGAGIGYEFHRNFEARAGFVDKNSFNHTMLYGGVNWHTAYSRPVYAGLFSGMASGYRDTPTGGDSLLIGFVQPNVGVIAYKKVRVEIGVVPEFFSGKTESTLWTLSAGFKF